ncbi:MAG TPA: hypothetical protein VFH87_07735 [Candidatus Udaeobacter sp.]|nr:hypothetical protein [Candidatus Udaeobacter sp.]
MKTLLTAVSIVCVLSFAAAAQEVPTAMPYPTKAVEQSPFLPIPNSHIIAGYAGPTLPAGWQIVNVESVIQNGTSVQLWLVYLWKPSTRQTYGYLVGLN